MTSPDFRPKPVHQLIREDRQSPVNRFWIPAYQRGYRWKPEQVQQLLEDILEFAYRKNPQNDDFYCLQPLVLKARDNGQYEVVDGQQRLTTLLLILRFFNQRLTERHRAPVFELSYETRPHLPDFLLEPSAEQARGNVDFFHLYQAMHSIEHWFDQHDNEVDDFKSTLLNRTKVIWYELAASENPVDAFTRLNIGKIPLTDDELIRALFLKRNADDASGETPQQLRIAHEWDQLEKALQNDALWYFLNEQPSTGQNRIGFLFQLVARLEGASAPARQRYSVFHHYSRRLAAPDASAQPLWQQVKNTCMLLEEWFEDRRLYHIIGFLVQQGVAVAELFALSQGLPKSQFEQRLRQRVFMQLTGSPLPQPATRDAITDALSPFLAGLDYSQRDRSAIRATLLLFNLASLLQNPQSNVRFQFDSFKKERWDIEHVRSVTAHRFNGAEEKQQWLQRCLPHLPDKTETRPLREALEAFIGDPKGADDEAFNALHQAVLEAFGENLEVDDSIGNLTLLDQKTNRSYKNAIFAVKRERLLALDQGGVFVPLCTRNLFLKCYSPDVKHLLFWGEQDRKGYALALLHTLIAFFADPQEQHA